MFYEQSNNISKVKYYISNYVCMCVCILRSLHILLIGLLGRLWLHIWVNSREEVLWSPDSAVAAKKKKSLCQRLYSELIMSYL